MVQSRTAVVAAGARADVVSPAMSRALSEDRGGLLRVASRVVKRLGLQPVLLEPVADRREAQPDLRAIWRMERPRSTSSRACSAVDASSSRMPGRVLRAQTVLLHPVRDRRRVLADLPRDRLDRPALRQSRLQPTPFHDTNTSSCGGRNFALLQAVADRVEHALALGGEGAHGALGGAGVDGGADLAVEAVEVELEGLELERGRGGVEPARVDDDLRDELGQLVLVAAGSRRGAGDGRAGARRRGGSAGT